MGLLRTIANTTSRTLRSLARSLEDPSQPISADALRDEAESSYTTDAGQNVSAAKMLGYAPLHQAVSMISGDVAKLPLNVYVKSKRGRTIANEHPVQKIIHRYAMVNEEVNGYKFWRRYLTSALLWGNAYAWIDRNNRGEVIGLYQLLPDRTWMERTDGKLLCRTQSTKGTRTFAAADVLHIEGLSINGVAGENTVRLFRQDFAIALAAKQFEARFFKNNMSAGGILQAKAGTSPDKVKKTQKLIQEKYSGSDQAFKTLVIRDAMQWISTQVDPQKAQLGTLKEHQIREIASMYNIAPSRLGLKDSISFNSEEAAKHNYYDGALSHWCIQLAAESTTKLLTPEERQSGMYVEHNVNALLWADAMTRSTIATIGIQTGRFSANETRGWENLDSYEGGDTYFYPLNLGRVGSDGGSDSAESDRARQRRSQKRRKRRFQVTREQISCYRHLLTESFSRAINRCTIRAERNKKLEDDRTAVVSIVESTVRNVASLVGYHYTDEANAWFDSLLSVDASSLRAHAEASSQQLIKKILSDPESNSGVLV
jgi:HK97 family phage portal protein